MKKFFYLLVCFTISSLVFAPVSDAWTWKTHSNIADTVYYGLPPEVQKNLNLQTMKDASNDPDEVFKDFVDHSYPHSYGKAESWLSKGKVAYDKGYYNEASYDYGVASHYISDPFSAPHCVSKEKSSDHTKYEDQAKKLQPVATFKSNDLNTLMQQGHASGASSWNEWLQSKSSAVIQNNLNDGASAALSAIKSSINFQAPAQPVTNTEPQNTSNATPNASDTTSYPKSSSPLGAYLLGGFVLLILIGAVVFFLARSR